MQMEHNDKDRTTSKKDNPIHITQAELYSDSIMSQYWLYKMNIVCNIYRIILYYDQCTSENLLQEIGTDTSWIGYEYHLKEAI